MKFTLPSINFLKCTATNLIQLSLKFLLVLQKEISFIE